MASFQDILGTIRTKFQLGLSGPQLKNNSGTIESRNAADTAYAQMRMQLAAIVGDDIVLNEQSTGSGASWKYTLRRPSTGMVHDLTVVMPSGDPAPGQALTVATFASNIVTLQWTTVAAGNDKIVVDTTTLSFGDASPKAMFTNPINSVVREVKIVINTPFTGAPSLSVGVSGTPSKYLASNQVDLTAPSGTVFVVDPGLQSVGTTEALIATYAPNGAGAGAARIEIAYAVPS